VKGPVAPLAQGRKTKRTFRQSFLRHFPPERPKRKTRRREPAGCLIAVAKKPPPDHVAALKAT
jgi:hypothetical protein